MLGCFSFLMLYSAFFLSILQLSQPACMYIINFSYRSLLILQFSPPQVCCVWSPDEHVHGYYHLPPSLPHYKMHLKNLVHHAKKILTSKAVETQTDLFQVFPYKTLLMEIHKLLCATQ